MPSKKAPARKTAKAAKPMPAAKAASARPQASPSPRRYATFLASAKEKIRQAQLRAAVAANAQLVELYWHLGNDILTEERARGWGAKFVEQLATDLRQEFPEMKGFSPRNLRYIKAFSGAWRDGPILQAVLAKLPWYHHIALLEKLDTPDSRLFYARSAIEHGWSRNVMVMHIERQLHLRQGAATTNFSRTLPEPQSDLARDSLKDPYVFDFLELAQQDQERDIERKLLVHVRDFLLELGVGFAFVGSQMRLEVGGEDFYLDLLFYHYNLRCFVVVELKNTPFKPAHAGQLNFYLSAVDDLLKKEDDKPTIGLLLCRSRDRVVVEYALRDVAKPIGVAEWKESLVASLPEQLAASLPTVEQIEASLTREEREKP